MKSLRVFFLLLFSVVFVSCETVWGVPQLEYRIEVHPNGSASWVIEHRFSKGENESLFAQLSNPTYFSDVFVKNVKSLVNATREKTERMNMTVENFVMTASVLGSYSFVEYQFDLQEFAETEDTRMEIGDVFSVQGLFLYGEGTVEIMYPSGYIVESVYPRPHAESNQTLTWYGIEDFNLGEPRIVLGQEKSTTAFTGITQENALLIGSLLALVGIGSVGIYYFKWKKREMISTKALPSPSVPAIEDDEEKVVNLLRAAGGSLYQSTIADQCGFSRAKASKLLAAMERRSKIRRVEKGREKVVTLIDKS